MALHWGILGTGRIAGIFSRGVLTSKHGKIVAIGSRSQEKADAFGKDFLTDPAIRHHASYDGLLTDRNVHAIYISTPHPLHACWAIAAMEAGKHVLCEKPIGLNHAEAMVILETARRTGRFCMEAYMYRCHPMMDKILEIIRAGKIGQVRAIHASFAFNCGTRPGSRLLTNALGGGGILDVGGYPVSFARMVAGAALGQNAPAEPTDIKAIGQLSGETIDEYTMALLKFPGNIITSVATGVQVNMDNAARIFGSEGSITFNRWIPADTGNTISITIQGKTEDIPCDADRNVYGLEADIAAEAIAAGKQEATFPAMSWADTLGNMKVQDAWRAAIGQKYESEKLENQPTISGKPLNVSVSITNDQLPITVQLPGLKKPISRLIMGVDNQSIDVMPHAAAMFDDYFQRGGNVFDSAWVYGGGKCEKSLGAWIKSRGVRHQVVILGKGAHTPFCTPKDITSQLFESLDRYATDHVDIYMMHRDNLEVPIGEFVDVLNEHVKAGRIGIFGGSNWTSARLDAANAYAKEKGRAGFAAVSNNFSLARMVDAPWKGCISASEPAFRTWLLKTQMPLLAWSSQARGFFVRGDPAYLADAEMARCWYAQDNFDRLARAKELAAKHNVTPIQIALAYVLHQGFPTLALIGPRAIEETRTSFAALTVKLTPDEVKWLNLE